MSFPKSPKKPVKGGLTLFVRKPDVSSDPVQEEKPKEISIGSLPGFSITEDPFQALENKKKYFSSILSDLKDKAKNCHSCKKITSLEAIALCESLSDYVVSDLARLGFVHLHVALGQETNGTLSIELSYRDKEVCFFIFQNIIRSVRYLEGNPISECGISEPFHKVSEQIKWLIQ